jgi:hypothetical protein
MQGLPRTGDSLDRSKNFTTVVEAVSGPYLGGYRMRYLRQQSSRGVKLTKYLHLVPRWSYTSTPPTTLRHIHTPLWCGAYFTTETTLPLPCTGPYAESHFYSFFILCTSGTCQDTIFWGRLCPRRQMLENCPKIVHDHFLLNNAPSSYMSMLRSRRSWRSVDK